MKKLVILLLVLGLVVVAALGFTNGDALVTKVEEVDEVEEAREEDPGLPGGVDYAAIYALHDPKEVVMTIDGRDVTWAEYFYAYYNIAGSMEQNFQMYMYYGMAIGWNSPADQEGRTYADILGDSAESQLKSLYLMERAMEEWGATLNTEEEEAVNASHREILASTVGEDAGEEELFKYLEGVYLPEDMYWRILRIDQCNNAVIRTVSEKFSEDDVLAWMEENGILSANHILIATVNLTTGEPLDETQAAEKAALAQQIAEELQAIEDPAEREARFLELKEQYCEDHGDYVFGPGVMEQAFYDGTQALAEGEVSAPVQTPYGYHIILRRPLKTDDTVMTTNGTMKARDLMADEEIASKMQELIEAQVVEYAPGFEVPRILDYYTKPEYTE